ncbi:hypothetical protein TWF694_004742 [Orbilia ellipsospora]|uniref:Uncharacterized protein n=1 Tax=Orbilia ellipsospora TaxID=2528407 RepID=A0AAV9WX53_9PEZI
MLREFNKTSLLFGICALKLVITLAIWREKSKQVDSAVVLLELAGSTLTEWTLIVTAVTIFFRSNAAENREADIARSGSSTRSFRSRNSQLSSTSTTESSLIRRTAINYPMEVFLRMKDRQSEADLGRRAGTEMLDSSTKRYLRRRARRD